MDKFLGIGFDPIQWGERYFIVIIGRSSHSQDILRYLGYNGILAKTIIMGGLKSSAGDSDSTFLGGRRLS